MRPYLLLIATLTIVAGVFAGTPNNIGTPGTDPAKVTLISSAADKSVVRVDLGDFGLTEVQTPAGAAFVVTAGNTTPIQEAGAPDLPRVAVSLVIPEQAEMSVRITASEFRDYEGINVAPSKGVISRAVDPATVPFTYGAWYAQDDFYPATLASTGDPYLIRDTRGQTVWFHPFRYNPVTHTLRVYSSLTVELYKSGDLGLNPLPAHSGPRSLSPDFRTVLSRHFLNFDAMDYTPVNDYGRLLVICHGPFMSAIQPYVDWKRAEGYETDLVPRDSAGSTAAQIKTYIANYYNTKGVTHVLLVGDAAQVPTNTGGGLGGPSDNAYGYVAGNDHYSDIFIGRFSAETEAQVTTQVQRTLDYEQNPQFLTDDWYTTVIGIASDQGPGDDNEYDYQHIRHQQEKLLTYTYTANPELFDGSQGGNDAPGNPTPPMVATEVNAGSGLILYCGHGSSTSWGTSGFSNANVNQLTNTGMLPFIWSVACVNGQFNTGTCFAEAWLRASQGGVPTGAIAFLGSTINQSWNSPMAGQDEMTDILAESYPDNIKRTFAGISLNGCMKMIDQYGTDGANMADTWTVFGDPTIAVRTAVPQPLTVAYDTLLFITDSTLSVYCNVPEARVTATMNGQILATSLVAGDSAMLTFPPLATVSDTVHIVVTAYNRLPYIASHPVRDFPEPIVAGFRGLPTSVTPGNYVAFADTSLGLPTHRMWYFPGGTPETSSDPSPVITYNTPGIYDVKLVVGDMFTSDSALAAGYILVDWPTRTGSPEGTGSFTMVPNPSSGMVTLQFGTAAKERRQVTVACVTGETAWTGTLEPNGKSSQTIDLTSLPEGIYFVTVTGTTERITRKLVIRD